MNTSLLFRSAAAVALCAGLLSCTGTDASSGSSRSTYTEPTPLGPVRESRDGTGSIGGPGAASGPGAIGGGSNSGSGTGSMTGPHTAVGATTYSDGR